MDKYYARVCWNTHGWRSPSGDAALLETDTYATKDGFGHEECLFNFMWLFDGYHYAFLQPINNSSRTKSGQIIEVLLWAIDASKRRVYIGKIKNCEVLTEAQSLRAYEDHKNAGWLKMMKADLAAVNGNAAKLSPDGLFNVRFRPEDSVQFDDPLPVAKPTDRISKLTRYKLVAATQSEVNTQWKVHTRRGSLNGPELSTHIRGGSNGGLVDPYHPVLQKALMKLLQERFGYKNVVREAGWVDLTVTSGKRRLLIEIKTDPVAKRAIREALGQILEYAFFYPRTKLPDAELFIVAPAPLNEEEAAYLLLLKEKFGVPVTYSQFLPDGNLPPAFIL